MHLTVDQWIAVISALAILTSPLAALQVQRWLDAERAHSDRKMAIFRTLMTTRTTQIAPAHIEALNAIEVEFYATGGPDKSVLDAWRLYVAHVNTKVGIGPDAARWVETKTNRLVSLLLEMSKSLGYRMDEAAIRTNMYRPQLFADIEEEAHALRKAALEVFSGQRPLQTALIGSVQVAPELPSWEEVSSGASIGAGKPVAKELPGPAAKVLPEPKRADDRP